MRKRILLPLMVVPLALGFAASYATTPVSAVIADTLTTDTSAATTTDPVTTDPTSTETTSTTAPDPTTTTASDPTTTTTTPAAVDTTVPETATTTATTPAVAPTTSTATGATTSTTAVVPTTGGGNSASSDQASDQADVASPGGAGAEAGCDPGTGVTCGNNASTQIALVEQVCNAASDTAITTDVTVGGSTTSYAASPNTTCNNVAYITQVVNQVCVNCTLKLHITYNTYATYSSTTQQYVQQYVQAAVPNLRAFYCAPQPVLRADGTTGRFLDLALNQPLLDPRYYGAVPAVFVEGVGMTCPQTPTAAAETQTGPRMVAINVPLGFVGQYLNVCSSASRGVACRSLKIDAKGFVAFPVDANIICTITKKPAGRVVLATSGAAPAVSAEKSATQIASAANAYGAAGASALGRPRSTSATAKVRKGRK